MGFLLADGISFCRPGERLVFLDLERDRYFALPPEAETAFERLLAADPLSARDREQLLKLERHGLLVEAVAGSRPSACRPPRTAELSLVDEQCGASPVAVAAALARFAAVRLQLRRRPLRTVLGRLERRKARRVCRNASDRNVRTVAGAFHRGALFVSPLDKCLPRSIAAAHALLDRGCRPELVIGVSAQPFAAHCWVQWEELLVTERLDEVRNFTPILTL
jgi:hypothetical protein